MSRSNEKSVVVTGVSSGIGQAIAEDLLKKGYRVFGSVRNASDAEALICLGGTAFTPLIFDVTDSAAIEASVRQVEVALDGKGLTALVNNAGVSFSGPLAIQPQDEIRQTFEVNVFGLIAVTRNFLPLLGGNTDRGLPPGRVVNVGSVSGAITMPFMGAYSASKHAVEALTQAFRRELIPFGIHVSAVEPSLINSRIFEKADAEMPFAKYPETNYSNTWRAFSKGLIKSEANAKEPEIVARAVMHAIESKKPKTRYPLDPIWCAGRVLPDRVFDILAFKALGLNHLMKWPKL